MTKVLLRKFKLGTAHLALALGMISAPAFAQDAPAAEAGVANEIVVTGSRIVGRNQLWMERHALDVPVTIKR